MTHMQSMIAIHFFTIIIIIINIIIIFTLPAQAGLWAA
jgi:hypothetical protein